MIKKVRQNKPSSTTFVLGAGFSKCADLPTQSEFSSLLLSNEFSTDLDQVINGAIKRYLKDVFGWKEGNEIPSLEDIFTCIDLSASTGHHLGIHYTPKVLRALRRLLIYRIFSILDKQFKYSKDITELLNQCFASSNPQIRYNFVVLNWDIVLERHLSRAYPSITINYCCPCSDWNNPDTPVHYTDTSVPVCKMYGSSNWVYCDNCKSLFFDIYSKLSLNTKAGLIKSDFRLFDTKFTNKKFDASIGISPKARECKFCRNIISSHIATFSYIKSFRTPAYPSIWYHAEKLLSDSERWVFIGYSLPEADYELKHLLKAAQLRMLHRNPHIDKSIEVVTLNDLSTIHKFTRFFGSEHIAFYNNGLSEYVGKLSQRNQ